MEMAGPASSLPPSCRRLVHERGSLSRRFIFSNLHRNGGLSFAGAPAAFGSCVLSRSPCFHNGQNIQFTSHKCFSQEFVGTHEVALGSLVFCIIFDCCPRLLVPGGAEFCCPFGCQLRSSRKFSSASKHGAHCNCRSSCERRSQRRRQGRPPTSLIRLKRPLTRSKRRRIPRR